MPIPVVKKLAEQSGKTIKEVEDKWEEAKKIVKTEKKISETNKEAFYGTVYAITKNMLGIKKVNEDATATTTSDIATYAKRLGEPVKRADFDKPDGYHGNVPFYEMKELGDYMDIMKNIKTGQKVSFKEERIKSGINKYGMAYIKHKTNFPVLVKRNNIYNK